MDLNGKTTALIVLIAILWLACMFLGWYNHYVLGMCLGVVLMFIHMLLGASKNKVISKKFLMYPLLIWALLWTVGFILAGYFAKLFAGVFPGFTVFGIHPSFATTVFLYWIGGMLTLNLGLYLNKDEWLSEAEWEAFIREVNSKEAK